jgi:translocation and assembly module TamA
MLHVAPGQRVVAALAAAVLFLTSQARAQDADPYKGLEQPLDPSAPLDPLPELGVDWPDMDQPASEEIQAAPTATAPDASAERAYAVKLEGLEGIAAEGLVEQFNTLSVLEANRGDETNAAQVDRRAREDAQLLRELLRAYGYYDAAVETSIEAGAGAPAQVVLAAQPGPQYRFTEVRLAGIDAAGVDAAALREAFGVDANDPVNAAAVTSGEAALRVELGRRGYAFADVGTLDVTVDHATRTATLVLPVQPNGTRTFGNFVVEGKRLFGPGHLQTIARFEPGDTLSTPMVDDLRRALIATGLVSTVAIRPVARQGSNVVDLAVALETAPMRTVAGEFGYGTGEGVRLEASWEHRNLIRPEGAVRVRGVAGTQEQLVSATLRRNNYRERDQVLTAQIAASSIDRRAYDAKSFFVAAGLERQTNLIWQKKWTWSVVVAGRARLGTIFGARRDRIAPSRRFYAGGGGSVRGYSFQGLGPRDPVFDDPIGGRSLAEFALEARVRIGNFGIVPFIDAGNIYTSPLPELDDLRFGAGIGVRYHTRFGPIRVDVGTPLSRQSGDPRVAVYVSLGQAF